MSVLNFGHRLALLKDAWDFPINDEIAEAIGGSTRSGSTGVNKSTISRWVTSERGGKPRDHDLSDVVSGLAKFFDAKGYFARFDSDQAAFTSAFHGSDLDFSRYISSVGNKPLPVPKGLRSLQASKINGIEPKIVGYSLMYRLGIDVERRGKIVFMNRGAKNVLRVIPIRITKNGDMYDYFEEYFNTRARGFVFVVDQYVTIFGEDADNEGNSELFMSQMLAETNKDLGMGLFDGTIAMDGDMGLPTAYRMAFERVDSNPENTQEAWMKFVEKNQQSVLLRDDEDGKMTLADENIENAKKFEKIVDFLQIKSTVTDLQN